MLLSFLGTGAYSYGIAPLKEPPPEIVPHEGHIGYISDVPACKVEYHSRSILENHLNLGFYSARALLNMLILKESCKYVEGSAYVSRIFFSINISVPDYASPLTLFLVRMIVDEEEWFGILGAWQFQK